MAGDADGRRQGATIRGLDGLRAVAIIGVLVYHLRPESLPGGYLGVDVFFVVSGFLITTLLLRELRDRGRLDLPHFWLRRARRLLPALLLVVLTSISLGFVVGGDLLVHIARQTAGALTFSNNWVEIAAGSDYFAHTSPLLFMNFWSLAVEEQFYLLWPLALAVIVACARTSRQRVGTALTIAGASALAMAVLFQLGDGSTRVYYGTDTHLFGLMLGAALAFAWAAPERPLDSPRWRAARVPAAIAALVGLLLLMLTLAQASGVTFRGGILLGSLLTAVLIAGLLGQEGPLLRLLELRPLTWVGQRSYGIYLWHWPMILIVAAALPAAVPDSGMSWFARAVALALTLVLSWGSYDWLETPVRRLGFRGAARAFLTWVSRPWGITRAPRITAGAVVVMVAVSAMALASAPDKSQAQKQIESGSVIAERSVAEATHDATAAPTAPSASPSTSGDRSVAPAPTRSSGAQQGKGANVHADFSMPRGKEITAFGDSLVVCSANALVDRFPGIMLDAESNRQWPAGKAAVEARLKQGTVRRAVLMDFGTNAGVHDRKLVESVLDDLGPDRMVVLVNLYGVWVPEGNEALAAIAAKYPNVIIADWHAAISKRPDLLQADGIHPGIEGAGLYADVVKAAFRTLSKRLQAQQAQARKG
jgi:peptidoglycan/LPS O-acetylase OafA/YrhL